MGKNPRLQAQVYAFDINDCPLKMEGRQLRRTDSPCGAVEQPETNDLGLYCVWLEFALLELF